MIKWLKQKWLAFGDWVQFWFPGWKTKATLAAGAIGSAAYLLQDYVSQIPASDYISSKTLAVANFVLFTLAFWFKRLSDRSEV